MSNSLWPHGLQHTRLPCPSPSPKVCSNSCSLSRWCHPTISASVGPFSCLQSFSASGSFPMSWLSEAVHDTIKMWSDIAGDHRRKWGTLIYTCCRLNCVLSKDILRTSLVSSDWESACQYRGNKFNPWSRKIPDATKPVFYNYWAHVLQLLRSPGALEPMLQQETLPRGEVQVESSACSRTARKTQCSKKKNTSKQKSS